MKKLPIKIFYILGYLASYVYTLKLKSRISHLYDIMHTAYISRFLLSYGCNILIQRPIYLANPKNISIGNKSSIRKRVSIMCIKEYHGTKFTPQIIIGSNCDIGDDTNIQCCNKIILGNGVLIGRKVMINDTSHGIYDKKQLDIQPYLRPLTSKGPIIIEENVWIGEHVSILGNVRIGKGSIIAAGAVVTHDIPPYSLAAGIPAKIIKKI